MIEINLIPDVKYELLQARRFRNLVIFVSLIVMAVCGGAIVLTASWVFGAQEFMISGKHDQIKKEFEKMSSQPNAGSTVTLRNQLNQISNLRHEAPNTSRILDQVVASILPTSYTVTYSSLAYDAATRTLSVDAQSSGGFPALEAFIKTINETKIYYRKSDAKGVPCTTHEVDNNLNSCVGEFLADGDVVVSGESYGDSDEGGKVLRFKVDIVLNRSALAFTSKDFGVLPPGKKDVTDSKIQVPDDIFKERAKDQEEK